jgi:predicted transcriptional regulator
MVELFRKEREALVIALYKKGKTYREIAKELRMSPNIIKAILNKEGLDQSTSMNSRAFELYSQRKTPLEVAISLNLEADDALRLHQDYYKLLGCSEFIRVYQTVKDGIWAYVNLMKLAIEKQMSAEKIMKLLDSANNDLLLVESKYENLKRELDSLDCKKNNANKDYQLIRNEVSNLQKERDPFQSIIEQLRHEIAKLNQQEQRIENFVKNFQNNNEVCMKIKQMVRHEIESVISNPRRMLRLVLMSIFESARRHPGKFQALYYNMSTATLAVRSSLQALNSQNGYNEDALEQILLDEAELIYDKLVNDVANKCINEIPTKSSSQELQMPDIQKMVCLLTKVMVQI